MRSEITHKELSFTLNPQKNNNEEKEEGGRRIPEGLGCL